MNRIINFTNKESDLDEQLFENIYKEFLVQ